MIFGTIPAVLLPFSENDFLLVPAVCLIEEKSHYLYRQLFYYVHIGYIYLILTSFFLLATKSSSKQWVILYLNLFETFCLTLIYFSWTTQSMCQNKFCYNIRSLLILQIQTLAQNLLQPLAEIFYCCSL